MSEAYKKGIVVEDGEDKQLTAYVKKVGLSVLKASGLANQQNWEIIVVRSNEANAFVSPNGKIVVYTGILPVAQNEAGLAAIIGHEIAHISSKHTAERLSQTIASGIGLNAASAYLDKNKNKYNQNIEMGLSLGVKYGLLLPYNRGHENEADLIGQIYMAKAGYDPKEAVYVWQRMNAANKNTTPEFLSTHPSASTRINNLKKSHKFANMYYLDQSKALPKSISELQREYREQSERELSSVSTDLVEAKAGYWYKAIRSDSGVIYVNYADDIQCGDQVCTQIFLSNGEKRLASKDFKIMKVEHQDSWTSYTPGLSMVRYPLEVNKIWVDDLIVTTSSGQSKRIKRESRVVDYAEVPVGTEMIWAYRVLTTQDGKKTFDGWWAPTLCAFTSSTQSFEGNVVDTQLLDYKKQTLLKGKAAVNQQLSCE